MSAFTAPYRALRAVVLLLVVTVLLQSAGAIVDARSAAGPNDPASTTALRQRVYLPMLSKSDKLAMRLGYGSLSVPGRYPEAATLRAGWYLNWTVTAAPQRVNGIEYVQTVRLHQRLVQKAGCELGGVNAHDRSICPYAQPLTYDVFPNKTALRTAVLANRGSLWLIGNEIDRRDWPGGGQDEMLPETYAEAYHDLYRLIKDADPTARVANAGVIQATPLRLEYLTRIWDSYLAKYGAPMPVDVWNVHNFILKEKLNDYGASIPPGSSATEGVLYASDWTHVDLGIFKQQIAQFRQWMKARGQQDKPLIVSEYGVLYYHDGLSDPNVVSNFMLGTFDYFLNARDCSLGNRNDDCRLVQRWAWYSLDDTISGFNPYSALFNAQSLAITPAGAAFRQFATTNLDALSK